MINIVQICTLGLTFFIQHVTFLLCLLLDLIELHFYEKKLEKFCCCTETINTLSVVTIFVLFFKFIWNEIIANRILYSHHRAQIICKQETTILIPITKKFLNKIKLFNNLKYFKASLVCDGFVKREYLWKI